MAKLRISIVEYLNTAPLVWGFTEGPLAGKYDLSFTVPSECAEALRRGAADVAIIPSIEVQRIPGVVALPGISIAARGEVRSILVLSKTPIENVKRLALDASSRSSTALVHLLAAGHWGIHPEYVEAPPNASEMLQIADAALLIGDPALRVAVKMDALAEKIPSTENCCGGDPEELPVPGQETLFVYDLAYQWREMTGLPCVLALWAGRREAITPEVVADFQESKRYGLERIPEIADAASLKLELPPEALEKYLSENIHYGLDPQDLEGLNLYFRKCGEAGLTGRARPLEFAAALATGQTRAGTRR